MTTEPAITFSGRVKSDQLRELASLLGRIKIFRHELTLVEAVMVLDANTVIADIIWQCKKRKNPTARSTLLELLQGGTVRAYAPTYLIEEMDRKVIELEAKTKIPAETLRMHWECYRPLITYEDVGGADDVMPGVGDPEDIPYLRLQQKLDAPLVTADKDLARMNATVIRVQILAPLRDYSRQRAVEYQIKVAGIGAILITALLAKVLAETTVAAGQAIGRLPRAVLAAGAIGLGLALIYPTSRKWIFDQLEATMDVGVRLTAGIYEVLVPIIQEHYAAKQKAEGELATFEAFLKDAGVLPEKILHRTALGANQPKLQPKKQRARRAPRRPRRNPVDIGPGTSRNLP